MTDPSREPVAGSHRLRRIAISGVALLSLLGIALWWLARESTLIAAANFVSERLEGRLQVNDIHGSLLSDIRVRELRYEDTFGTVAINNAEMRWRPVRLLMGQVAVGAMSADTVALELEGTEPEERQPPQSLRAPMSFAITDLHIGTLTIRKQDSTHEIRDLRAAFAGGKRRLSGELKSLNTNWGRLQGELKIGANHPFPLAGHIELTSFEQDAYGVKVDLDGSLLNAEAMINAKLREGIASAKLAVAPYDDQPLTLFEFTANNFDPRSWRAAAPAAALNGSGRIVAGDDRKLTGVIAFTNDKPGSTDAEKLPIASMSAGVEGDENGLDFPLFKLDLGPAGAFSGRGEWQNGTFALKLHTGQLNLNGIQSTLHKTQLAGNLEVGGDAVGQRVRLNLSQEDYQFRLAAALSESVVQVSEAYARGRGAQVSARGTLALNEQKAFKVAGRLENFDPAQFGAYPPQRINSRFEVKGTFNPIMQVSANVTLTDSRLFDLPATARGTVRSTHGDRPDVALDVALRIGDTQATAKGTIRDPAKMESLDLNLTLAGASLEELYKISNVPLPPTPPYQVQGRLVHTGAVWEFQKFSGTVGESDLAGTFVLDRGRSPQFIKANLISNRLDLADLHGFIGADKAQDGHVVTPDPNRVLPKSPYSLEKLKGADADVQFQGKRIMTEKLPVENMNTRLLIKGGVAHLAPLDFGVAGGRLVSDITLDGSGPVMASRADVTISSLQLAQLMPKLESAKASVGELHGRVRLAGHGDSIAAMLGSANGDTVVAMGEGEFSDLMLRLSNLDVANTLLVLMRGDRRIEMRCGVADVAFENGVMRPRQFVIDTAHTTLVGEGSANFAQESLDLRLVARAKDVSLMSLRGPIHVRGTFAHPSALPDMKRLAARGAAATALGVLAFPLAIVPFVQPGKRQDLDCSQLLQTAQDRMRGRKQE